MACSLITLLGVIFWPTIHCIHVVSVVACFFNLHCVKLVSVFIHLLISQISQHICAYMWS